MTEVVIDMPRYSSMAPDVRARFDDWYHSEPELTGRHVTRIEWTGEGVADITFDLIDENGQVQVDGDEIVQAVATVTLRSMPASEAFGD